MIIKYKNQEFVCLLDPEDEIYFSQWNWFYRKGYVGRNRRKTDPIGNAWVHLHHEVLLKDGNVIPPKYCVDHINWNKMDNRKENLRIVTRSVNSLNVSESIKQKRKITVKFATLAASKQARTEKQLKLASKQARNLNKMGKNRHIGKNNMASKPVINIITKIIYDCVRDAAQQENMNYSTLKSKLNGSLKNNTNLIHLDKYHSINLDKEQVQNME